ncbi:hypothetical protein HZP35_15250 [Elizabethkingia anophelis]|nr:hypothetical protein [Elizabethkingia anophelis]MCT4156294.1 hypothetical protein [Elizabethkingia anophelis]MCT4170618.1 hypothetical protein [Elizabethkingia anophelis]MCT4245034.1 hypothetical protein [Elizabethkingia anophelis]MCT4248845.1 hypothetical protein [Elizabethkingia anophelis]
MANFDFLKNFDFWAVIVSVISLLWTAITSRKLNTQQKELNKQQKTINEFIIKSNKEENEGKKKANIVVDTIQIDKGTYNINIRNAGPSKAHFIRAEWNGLLDDSNGIIIINKNILPYKLLNPGEKIEIRAVLASNHITLPEIQIQWADDYFDSNIRTFILPFD